FCYKNELGHCESRCERRSSTCESKTDSLVDNLLRVVYMDIDPLAID
ncbi:31716_t:CDS:1, partial [Gigaspora margarita]